MQTRNGDKAAWQIESEGTVAGNAEILRRVMLQMYAQRGNRYVDR
jgi:hypothetical protein